MKSIFSNGSCASRKPAAVDELVFATGSRPFIPPLPGIDRPQVMPFRTTADVERILAIPGPAVVIGGGVLGVEAAAALRRHGGEVTLLHRGSGLMAPLTDALPPMSSGSSLKRAAFAACWSAASPPSTPMACGWRTGAYSAPPEWCWLPACSPTAVWRRSPACCASGDRGRPSDGLLAAGDQRHR